MREEEKGPTSNLYNWLVPKELHLPADPIRLRLDFHHQSVELTDFEGDFVDTRVVSAYDIAVALSEDLSVNTGLLPSGTIWWKNTRNGSYYAFYIPPRMRSTVVQVEDKQHKVTNRRYTIPMPGLIFICSPHKAPWVYAVKKDPESEKDAVYRAPMPNIHPNGKSCGGSHNYPDVVSEIPESFFTSFFTNTDDLEDRSVKFPKNIIKLWQHLDKQKVTDFPLEDLVYHGTIQDLLKMEMG
jgi:PRTRC genetic system protein B